MKIQLKAIWLNHFIIGVVISVLILSCNSRKHMDRITRLNIIYKNNTKYDILINAYRYGNIINKYLIKKNDSLVQRGSIPGSSGNTLIGYESIEIISNNNIKRIYKDSTYKTSLFDLKFYNRYKKDKEFFWIYTFLE